MNIIPIILDIRANYNPNIKGILAQDEIGWKDLHILASHLKYLLQYDTENEDIQNICDKCHISIEECKKVLKI